MTRHLTPVPEATAIDTQVVTLSGTLNGHVQAATPIAGPGQGWITLTIGGISLRFDDLLALECFAAAWAIASNIGRLTLPG